MVDELGKPYIVDHAMDCLKQERRAQAYEAYVAECLRLCCENIASITKGKYIPKTWIELCEPQAKDDRTGDEVASDVIIRLGLSFGGADK